MVSHPYRVEGVIVYEAGIEWMKGGLIRGVDESVE